MAGSPKAATARQVAAWKKRNGHSLASGAAEFNIHIRTFCRWLSGESESPKWLGERFRTEGVAK